MSIFYTGSYTCGKPSGIYVCRLDDDSGKLVYNELYELKNATYLAISNSRKYLYAGFDRNELAEGIACSYNGIIRAYGINADDSLKFLNEVNIEGNHSCHLSVSADDKFLYTANYAESFAAVFELSDHGDICALKNIIRHQGSGVNLLRQENAHPHFTAEFGNGFAVCDLGLDKIIFYSSKGEAVSVLDSPPGAGPRHFEYLNGIIYVINELSCDICVHRVIQTGGIYSFEFIQRIALCDELTKTTDSTAAAIHISPDNKFLAASLRGANVVSIFAIGTGGELELLSVNNSGGECPRDFSFDPSGKYIVCANCDSDNIVLFRFMSDNGRLEEIHRLTGIHMPVCVKFK